MKNIHQVQLIKEALTKEKKKHSLELTKINNSIEKKSYSILRMVAYQKDYANSNNLQLTHSTPALSKNLSAFSKKINDVIKQAEVELNQMKNIRDSILHIVSELDKKIDLMEVFEQRSKVIELNRLEKTEQNMLDDIVSTNHLRNDYE